MLLFRVADDDGVTAFCSEENMMMSVYIISCSQFCRLMTHGVMENIPLYQSTSLSLSRRFNTITYPPNARFHETELFICVCMCGVCILLRRAHNKEKISLY